MLVVFAATAAAARILKLTPTQTLHALALAFNRCGGSFQSNVDGTLAVRVVQGFVAETGVDCAQMAQRGITGPPNFINGHYGYAHLYGRDRLDVNTITAGLGHEWRLQRMVFKKYPSCGVTQGVTDLALALLREEGLTAEQVRSARVRLPPVRAQAGRPSISDRRQPARRCAVQRRLLRRQRVAAPRLQAGALRAGASGRCAAAAADRSHRA